MLCVLIFTWICSILTQAYRAEGDQIVFAESEYFQCNEGWLDAEGQAVDLSKVKFTLEDLGKTFTYRYKFPPQLELQDGSSLCFYSRGLDLKIYATASEHSRYFNSEDFGSRKLYEFAQNGAGLTGTDIGLVLQMVPIYKPDLEHELRLEVTPAEASAFILDLRVQKTSDFLLSTIRSRIGMFVQSIIIVFFGIALMLYTFFSVVTTRRDRITFYSWGAFSVCVGLLLLIETQIFQFLTGKPELYNAFKYALILILAFPQAMQTDATARHPHKHYSILVGVIVAILLFWETVACFFMNVSMYRLFFIFSLPLLAVNNLITIIYFIKDVQYTKQNPEASFSALMLGIMVLLSLFAIIDIGIYAQSGMHMTDWGRLMRWSYLVFIVFMLVIFLRLSIRRDREAKLANMYKMQARTDALTGLLNRAAYIERENVLTQRLLKAREHGQKKYSFVIVSLDLNNLKKVNDHLGHNAGDEYIKHAAAILRESVGSNGEVYRVGGDEFLALLFGEDPENIYQQVKFTLNRNVDRFNAAEKPEFPLSFAFGHSLCSTFQHYSIHDSERLADQEMYECKKEMKITR
ncbi:MAG: diguanylate cyclase [Succinivibrio sp.]|nr:diguanylate cyclase [Succinivibrio sp.]